MKASEKKRTAIKKSIGPGLHAAVVELEAEGSYRVRLANGAGRARAHLAPDVPRELVRRCMANGTSVLVEDGERGPLIVGALARHDLDGIEVLELSAETLRLRAKRSISIEVGTTKLVLTKDGKIQIKGEQLVADIGALVRFLSERVELP